MFKKIMNENQWNLRSKKRVENQGTRSKEMKKICFKKSWWDRWLRFNCYSLTKIPSGNGVTNKYSNRKRSWSLSSYLHCFWIFGLTCLTPDGNSIKKLICVDQLSGFASWYCMECSYILYTKIKTFWKIIIMGKIQVILTTMELMMEASQIIV